MKRRSFIKKTVAGTAAFITFDTDTAVGSEISGIKSMPVDPDKPLRITVVQQDGNPGEVKANREKALSFARKALDQKADVILYHEEMLIGYHKDLKELAEPVDGETTKAFREILKGTGSMVIYGLTEKDGNDYYISAPVVSEDGVIANYRKTHLWWKSEGLRHEPAFYKPGDRLVTFDIKGYLCGIMICYDGDFPEMTRSYANLGCSVLFWMNNRNSRGHDEVKELAKDNSIIMPVSCCCGIDEAGRQCRGGSNITGPKGELLSEIWDKEGLITIDVYPGRIETMRRTNPWYTGLRKELYYYK